MNSPLLLNVFFVENLSYRAALTSEFDPTKKSEELHGVDYDVTPNGAGGFTVRLRVQVSAEPGKNCRGRLKLSLIGFFTLADGIDERLKNVMLTQNAPSILYGIARQIVAETTGNGPWGKIFLGTVNFLELAQAKDRAKPEGTPQAENPVVSDKPRTRNRRD
jgi:preprotein translocase subunit SecB